MTEVNYNGKEELLMADYEGISDSDLSSKYANTDFDITDAPSTYITNTQMTYALTCHRLFPAGDTYICNDEGTYKKGHTYTIKVDGATKSWEDVTPTPTIDDTPTATSNNPVKSSGIYTAIQGKQDQLSQEQLDAVNSGIDSTKVAQIEINKNNIIEINEKIPSEASSSNQLADKNFVNSSINNIAAYYITYNAQGEAFPTRSALMNATTFYSGGEVRTPTRNDYCIVRVDETQDNATTRYSYQNNQWEFQYVVNETPMTAAQVAAINSGITNILVAQITTNQNDITALQSGKQNVLTAGINITIDDNNVISASGGAQTYLHSVKISGSVSSKKLVVYFNKLSGISTAVTDLASLQALIGDDVLVASGYFVASIKINAGVSTVTSTCNLPVLTISKTTIMVNGLMPGGTADVSLALTDITNLTVTDNFH